MKKTVKHWILPGVVLVMGCCWLAGCGGQKELPALTVSSEEDPFADSEENLYFGSITHGIDYEAASSNIFEYNGEKMEIPYSVTAEGVVSKVGFLIFVDGILQPYQVDDTNSDYAYLHQLDLEDKTTKDFRFLFEPVTGQAGDELDICVVSVTSQIQGADHELLFGASQSYLFSHFRVRFNSNTVPPDFKFDGYNQLLVNPTVSDEELTLEKITIYTDDNMMDDGSDNDLNKEIYEKLYLSGADVSQNPLQKVGDKTSVEVRHAILGHPGIQYRTTIFLDYVPLAADGQFYFDRDLESGISSLLDAEINLSAMDGNHILSVISVPCNASDYPDDVIETRILSVFLNGTQEVDDEN